VWSTENSNARMIKPCKTTVTVTDIPVLLRLKRFSSASNGLANMFYVWFIYSLKMCDEWLFHKLLIIVFLDLTLSFFNFLLVLL
jgi:hypothetical protein